MGVGTVYADVTKIRQAVINLLGNASKFTKNGKVTLNSKVMTENDKDWFAISVQDSGIGMTPEQVDKLFRPFSQADSSTTRKFGGTGLGLTIVRHFCQLMGGDILVESVPGVGSTFTMKIPTKVEEPEVVEALRYETVNAMSDVGTSKPNEEVTSEPNEEVTSEPNEGDVKLLVIDDDPSVHDLVKRAVRKEGFWVVCASDGIEGLKKAKEIEPDVITLDIKMPGMDGWEVIGALKADEKLSDVPVIILSIVDDRVKSFEMGASDFLLKPISRETLLGVLSKHRGIT